MPKTQSLKKHSSKRINLTTKNELVIENKMFVSPVKGQITQKFDPLNNHFALDILVTQAPLLNLYWKVRSFFRNGL